MIVVNKDTISGNAVLQPEEVPDYGKGQEKNREKEKLKREKLRQKRIKNKAKILRNILLIFVIGLLLVGRYCIIYNMQTQLNSINNDISKLNSKNEQLKVNLVQYNNIQYIESTAINKLHMVFPNKTSIVYTDLDKKNISTTPQKESRETKEQNIWDKLIKFLY